MKSSSKVAFYQVKPCKRTVITRLQVREWDDCATVYIKYKGPNSLSAVMWAIRPYKGRKVFLAISDKGFHVVIARDKEHMKQKHYRLLACYPTTVRNITKDKKRREEVLYLPRYTVFV